MSTDVPNKFFLLTSGTLCCSPTRSLAVASEESRWGSS